KKTRAITDAASRVRLLACGRTLGDAGLAAGLMKTGDTVALTGSVSATVQSQFNFEEVSTVRATFQQENSSGGAERERQSQKESATT
ncbi:unnamed protein product, partial [Onchocerca ochengi]